MNKEITLEKLKTSVRVRNSFTKKILQDMIIDGENVITVQLLSPKRRNSKKGIYGGRSTILITFNFDGECHTIMAEVK